MAEPLIVPDDIMAEELHEVVQFGAAEDKGGFKQRQDEAAKLLLELLATANVGRIPEWQDYIKYRTSNDVNVYDWLISTGLNRLELYDTVSAKLNLPLYPLPSAVLHPLTLQIWRFYLERFGKKVDSTAIQVKKPWLPVGHLGPLLVVGHYLPHYAEHLDVPTELCIKVYLQPEQYEALNKVCAKRFDIYAVEKSAETNVFTPPLEPSDRTWLELWLKDGYVDPGERAQIELVLSREHILRSDLPKGYQAALVYAQDKTPVIPIKEVTISDEASALLTSAICERYKGIPFNAGGKRIYVATSNLAGSFEFEDIVHNRVGGEKSVVCYYAEEVDILATLERIKSRGIHDLKAIARGALAGIALEETALIHLDDSVLSDVGVTQEKTIEIIVYRVIYQGVIKKASDIHFEQVGAELKIRYRVDGVLVVSQTIPLSLMKSVISKIKVMSSLDVTQTRLPQDGRISVYIKNRLVDLRVSVIPTKRGYEKIVIRIIDKSNAISKVSDLKLPKNHLERFNVALGQDRGLILITGPTGSGKTSTLYALLNQLNTDELNVSTVEEPIELEIEGLAQTATIPEIGLTFPKMIKHILRQDPDVIMVGEIRDLETTQTAIYAALTGHLVLSTVHTNDALRSVSRLLSLGMEPYLLADALLLLQAQRLVRVLCSCCHPMAITKQNRDHFKEFGVDIPENIRSISTPVGCAECNQTGYQGRVSVMEMVPVVEELQYAIAENRPFMHLRDIVRKDPENLNLYQEGLKRVLAGTTALEEISYLKPAFV